MTKKFFHYVIRAICIVTGFALLLSIPFLFNMNSKYIFDFRTFSSAFITNIKQLFDFNKAQFLMSWTQTDLLQNYLYSMKLFCASILLIIFIGFVLAAVVMMSPYKIRRKLRSIINFSEAIPDLLVMFTLQILVITIYKNTGIKLFQLYGFTGSPYFIPIIVISFLPIFFLAQFLIRAFEEELEKDYAIFAKAKGLTFSRIYIIHMLRNIFPMLIVQMRTLVWIILSNLFLVEYLFSLKAYTRHIANLNSLNPAGIIFNIILFIIPIILIELLIRLISLFSRGKEEARL